MFTPKGNDLVNPDGFVLEHPAIERLTKAGATLVSHDKSPGFEGAMMRDPSGIAIQFVKREQSVLLK